MFDEDRAIDTALCALGGILCTLEGKRADEFLHCYCYFNQPTLVSLPFKEPGLFEGILITISYVQKPLLKSRVYVKSNQNQDFLVPVFPERRQR